MLEELHAGHEIEIRRALIGQRFGCDHAIRHRRLRFELMQPGNGQRGFGQIDPDHARACLGHRFGKDAAAAADVEHRLAGEAAALRCDIAEAQRVDVVQGLELAGRVPPAMRQRTEFGEFGRVGVVDDFSHANDAERWRGCRFGRQNVDSTSPAALLQLKPILPEADARGELVGIDGVVSRRSATTRRPATQASVTWSRPVT